MKLLALALLASSALGERRSRSRNVLVAKAELELDSVDGPELEERLILTAITRTTVTDGPSRTLNRGEIDAWTQTAHYAS